MNTIIYKHGVGIIHQLNSEISLLKYHINQCQLKVWVYIDRKWNDEIAAAKISTTMTTRGQRRLLKKDNVEVLNPIIKRYQELSKELEKKKDLLAMHLSSEEDVNVEKTESTY